MQKVDYLLIINTQSPEGQEVSKGDIIKQHTNPTEVGGNGWNRPGIDYLIDLDGKLETILPEQSPNVVDLWGISEGKKGMNGVAKYVAYVGGRTAKSTKAKDTRTTAQEKTLAAVVQFYVRRFPKIQVLGFSQVPAKKGEENPSFDVAKWCEGIGIDKGNVF